MRNILLHYFIGVFLLVHSLTAVSESIQTIVLKHRDARDIQQVLIPLLPDGSAISVDQQRLIIRAPANVLKDLRAAVKRLDQPQSQLKVSVFRGKHPSTQGRTFATTDASVNRLTSVTTLNGQTMVVSEKGIAKIAVGKTAYANNIDVAINPPANNIANVIVNDDGLLEADSHGVVIASDENSGVVTLPPIGNSQGEALNSAQYQLVDNMTGLHLRLSLIGKNKVTVTAKVVSPSKIPHNNDEGVSHLALSTSLETVISAPLNEWFLIGEQSQFSHQAALNDKASTKNSSVYSTQTSQDAQQSVWLMVEKL